MLEYIIYHLSKENATVSLKIGKLSVFAVRQKIRVSATRQKNTVNKINTIHCKY